MFFDFLLVFVDDKNGVGNTDDNNQRRDQSGENSNLISKESNKPKSPNDSDAHHQQCDKSGSVRFEKQKENKSSYEQGKPHKHAHFRLDVLGIQSSYIRHSRNVNVDVVVSFKFFNDGVQLVKNKILSNFCVDNFIIEVQCCLYGLGFFVKQQVVVEGVIVKEMCFEFFDLFWSLEAFLNKRHQFKALVFLVFFQSFEVAN